MSMMACICFPRVRSLWLFGFVFLACSCTRGCSCWGMVVIVWVCGGNNVLAWSRASLINFGAVLNFSLNSCGDRICWVIGFWICVMVVMSYIYSLLRYLMEFFFCSGDSEGYCGEVFHANSMGVCLIGNSFWVVFMWISYSLSSRNIVRAIGDLWHVWLRSLGRC